MNSESIINMSADAKLQQEAKDFFNDLCRHKYSYSFEWLGRPIIQFPQDIVAMQELIWKVKPDLIIETGIAHGGSLVFSASILALLDLQDALEKGTTLDPAKSHRKVLGIDIDIRAHNRTAIEAHPLSSRIQMIQGSSIASDIIREVQAIAADHTRVLVCLDSNHTHEHVLGELEAYAHLTSIDSYCVVFDTVVEHMPKELFPDRPWGPGNNPFTAVQAYVQANPNFVVEKMISDKLVLTVAPCGYLRRCN